MAIGKHRLTALKVEKAKQCGYLSDGHGLYLKIRKGGSKTWAYIWTQAGKRTEMSLGSAAGAQQLSLARARDVAAKIRQQIGDGIDPRAERTKEAPKSFLEIGQALLSELKPTWKSQKTVEQWQRSLLVECEGLHAKPINSITDAECRKVVIPVWKRTPETGLRLRKRLERVLSYAEAHGMREGRNPARWEGHFKEAMIGSDKIKRKHFPAMPYVEIPDFIKRLQELGGTSALALEFTILTVARSGETLGALWSEIDFDEALWSIPAERMKNGFPHTVPLTPRTLEILRQMQGFRQSDFVFLGAKPNRPMSNMTMTMLMRRMKVTDYVPHGFRAAFRTWCGNETNTPREVAEAALSHRVGSAVELSYSRGDALEKRRRLMPLWASYCKGEQSGDVVPLYRVSSKEV
ncbi:integrase arm-type DNA-binding domain-containing protein [Hellea sp.]|nr:integrase arm-type DNA-binding domain-containing protein [Hellea sp.]